MYNPLFKSGAKEDINNCRPVSILPTLSKLIEKFMQKHLMNYLNTFDVLHTFQNGFRSGHSTETALTLKTERWLKAINDGNIVDLCLAKHNVEYSMSSPRRDKGCTPLILVRLLRQINGIKPCG